MEIEPAVKLRGFQFFIQFKTLFDPLHTHAHAHIYGCRDNRSFFSRGFILDHDHFVENVLFIHAFIYMEDQFQ